MIYSKRIKKKEEIKGKSLFCQSVIDNLYDQMNLSDQKLIRDSLFLNGLLISKYKEVRSIFGSIVMMFGHELRFYEQLNPNLSILLEYSELENINNLQLVIENWGDKLSIDSYDLKKLLEDKNDKFKALFIAIIKSSGRLKKDTRYKLTNNQIEQIKKIDLKNLADNNKSILSRRSLIALIENCSDKLSPKQINQALSYIENNLINKIKNSQISAEVTEPLIEFIKYCSYILTKEQIECINQDIPVKN